MSIATVRAVFVRAAGVDRGRAFVHRARECVPRTLLAIVAATGKPFMHRGPAQASVI